MNHNQPPKYCSICAAPYFGHGNNAWPVNDGRCCDLCNSIVVTARIRLIAREMDAPDWYVDLVQDLKDNLEKPNR